MHKQSQTLPDRWFERVLLCHQCCGFYSTRYSYFIHEKYWHWHQEDGCVKHWSLSRFPRSHPKGKTGLPLAWQHETEGYMMTSSNENIFRFTGPLCMEFISHRWICSQRPATRIFDVLFDLCLNKRFNKQPRHWWVEMPSCSLWCHYNVFGLIEITLDSPTAVPHQLKNCTVPIMDNDMAVIRLVVQCVHSPECATWPGAPFTNMD